MSAHLLVAERGSAGDEPPSDDTIPNSKRRSALTKPQRKQILAGTNEHKSKSSTICSTHCETKPNEISAQQSVSLADDLDISSSDEDIISIASFDPKNIIFEFDNDLCKEPAQNECPKDNLKVIISNEVAQNKQESSIHESDFIETVTKKPALKSQIVIPPKNQQRNSSRRSNWPRRTDTPHHFHQHNRQHPEQNSSKPFQRRQKYRENRAFGNNPCTRRSPNHHQESDDSHKHWPSIPQNTNSLQVPTAIPPTAVATATNTSCHCCAHSNVASTTAKNDNVSLSVDALMKLINNNKPKPKQSHGRAQRQQRAKEAKLKREQGFEAWWEIYGKAKK